MLQNFYMRGTSGEGDYLVIAYTDRGKIGYRPLPPYEHRVRIEPEESAINDIAESFKQHWASPEGGNIRFSRYVTDNKEFLEVLIDGLKALKGKNLTINPAAPAWTQRLAEKYSVPERDEKEIFMEASHRLLAQFKQSLR